MPEEDSPQSTPAANTAPAPSPEMPPVVSVEPEFTAPSEPIQTSPVETPTAQIPPNEPIAPESEPIEHEPDPIQPPAAAAQVPTSILHTARDLLNKARVSIQDRKRKKRDKIMQALNTKNKITNDEVEKLLHVSDATATRYLSALEKEGKIIQVGKQSKGILYIKTP